MAGKKGLIVKLHNRRVAGCIDNKGGEDGCRFMFKRLMPDRTIKCTRIVLSWEAIASMMQIASELNERKDV